MINLEFNNALISWYDRVLATSQTVLSSHGSGGGRGGEEIIGLDRLDRWACTGPGSKGFTVVSILEGLSSLAAT